VTAPHDSFTVSRRPNRVNDNRAGVNNKPQTYSREDVLAKVNAMDFGWAKGAAPEAKIDKSSAKEDPREKLKALRAEFARRAADTAAAAAVVATP